MSKAAPISGPDYSRLQATLVQSKVAKSNNSLYQTVNGLITGVKKFQDFTSLQITGINGTVGTIADILQQSFNDLTSSLNTLGTTVTSGFNTVSDSILSILADISDIQDELADRNSAIYGFSVTNSTVQALPDSTPTLVDVDTVVFDPGGLISSNTFTAPHAGQYLFIALVTFEAGGAGIRRVAFYVNGVDNISQVQLTNDPTNDLCVTATALLGLNLGDTVQVTAYQNSGAGMNMQGSFQGVRISYV